MACSLLKEKTASAHSEAKFLPELVVKDKMITPIHIIEKVPEKVFKALGNHAGIAIIPEGLKALILGTL